MNLLFQWNRSVKGKMQKKLKNFSAFCRNGQNSLTRGPIGLKVVLNERSRQDLSIGTTYDHVGHHLGGRPPP